MVIQKLPLTAATKAQIRYLAQMHPGGALGFLPPSVHYARTPGLEEFRRELLQKDGQGQMAQPSGVLEQRDERQGEVQGVVQEREQQGEVQREKQREAQTLVRRLGKATQMAQTLRAIHAAQTSSHVQPPQTAQAAHVPRPAQAPQPAQIPQPAEERYVIEDGDWLIIAVKHKRG